MKRRLSYVAAAAVVLAACASGENGSDRSTGDASPGGGNATVSIADVDGIGDVLVDSAGVPLYTADEEADGQVRCTDGCTSFWIPLEPDADGPTSDPGVPALDVIERPDGTEQVTFEGRLLYSFAQDSPGTVTGDGFEDDFGDQHLTWHVVRVTDTGVTTGGSTDDNPDDGIPGY